MGIARASTSGTMVVTTALANRATTRGPARRRNVGELIAGAKLVLLLRRDSRPESACRPAGGRPPRPGVAPARPTTARTRPAGAKPSPSPVRSLPRNAPAAARVPDGQP